MKKIVSSVVICLVALAAHSAEKLSWESRALSAGKANVVTGGYSVTKSLGVANFSPEFRMPVQLVYDSKDTRLGVFGDNWSSPQLESRTFPRDNGMEWTTPWGEKVGFFEGEKKNAKTLSSPYSDWEAAGSKGNWVIRHRDGWKFEYRDSYLREITSPAERSLAFEYEGKKLSKITQNGTAFVELKYTKEGLVSEMTVSGEKLSLSYENKQISVLPENLGNDIRTAEKTFLAEIRNGELSPLKYKYDESGFLCGMDSGKLAEKLEIQNETLAQRKAYLKKVEEEHAKLPNKAVYQEIRAGRLLKDKDYAYTYSPDGTVTMKDAEGRTSSISYNVMRGVLKVKDFSGLASEIYYFRRYDVAYNGKLRQVRDSRDRTVVNIRYDKDSGKPVIVRDMADNETFYSYDKNGNVSMVSRSESDNPRRPFMAFKYDARGNPVNVALLDKAGKPVHETRIQYDQHSQPISVEAEESSSKFQYNTFGLMVRSTDTFGRTVSREYDLLNRLSSIVDANGVCVSYRYSGARLESIGKYATAEKKDLLSSVKFSYDKDTGMLASVTDDKGRTSKFDRDAEGRVVAQYYPDSSIVKYTLDGMGRLEEVQDQNGNPIRFSYDRTGKIGERITAVGQKTGYRYNSFGLLESLRKGQGGNATGGSASQEITYSYDELDRCTRISYGNGQEKNIKYDSRGKILRVEDATRNTEDLDSHISKTVQSVDFEYDQFDRPVKKTYTKATVPFRQFASEKKEEKTTHEYAYTSSGRRKSLVVTFSDGSKKTTEWIYDSCGRIEKITDNGQEVVYRYDAKSRLAEKTLPGGLCEKYGYDFQGRLEQKSLCSTVDLKGTPLASLKYSYSKDGSVASREVNGKLQKYEYDLKGQLLAVVDDKGNAVEKYVYDPAGNILEKTVDGRTTKFKYDAANQLVTSTMPDGTRKTYEYDGAGRMVKEGDKTFTYGWLDKILKVEDSEKVSTFEYYADGQLAERHAKGVEEDFAWDGLALIRRDKVDYTVEPHPNGGNAIMANGKVMFNDMLGSSLGTVENGNFHGIERTSFGSAAGSSTTDFFTGKPSVEGLGYSFLMRNYRSELGKWQTADPIGYPDGWNNFAYCNNSLLSFFDPLGAASLHATSERIVVNLNNVYDIIDPTGIVPAILDFIPLDFVISVDATGGGTYPNPTISGETYNLIGTTSSGYDFTIWNLGFRLTYTAEIASTTLDHSITTSTATSVTLTNYYRVNIRLVVNQVEGIFTNTYTSMFGSYLIPLSHTVNKTIPE